VVLQAVKERRCRHAWPGAPMGIPINKPNAQWIKPGRRRNASRLLVAAFECLRKDLLFLPVYAQAIDGASDSM
jgi:hypothetical protein